MKNIVLKYGLVTGIFLGLFMVISFAFFYEKGSDMSSSETIGYSVMLIAFASMFFGIKQFRDQKNSGQISFGKALAIGLLISLVASLTYSLTWTLYTEISGFEFETMYLDMRMNQLEKDGADEATIAAEVAMIEEFAPIYRNPLLKFLITIIEPLPVGIIVSLFTALMLRRKDKAEIV